MDLSDSTGWVKGKIPPTPKPDLALYMKQRTFLIEVNTEEGSSIGTGFFINDQGLAITNWHVLPAGAEKFSTAYLYKENPDDSKIYTDKKRRIKIYFGQKILMVWIYPYSQLNLNKVNLFPILNLHRNVPLLALTVRHLATH